MSHDAIGIVVALIVVAGIIAEAIGHATTRLINAAKSTDRPDPKRFNDWPQP